MALSDNGTVRSVKRLRELMDEYPDATFGSYSVKTQSGMWRGTYREVFCLRRKGTPDRVTVDGRTARAYLRQEGSK